MILSISKSSSLNDKNELVSFCKQYYKTNHVQLMIIKEFEKDYSSERSLWWYTRHSFLSRLLNKALRTENIDIIFKFRFFIKELYRQLKNESDNYIEKLIETFYSISIYSIIIR